MLGLFVAGTLVADALAITGLAYNEYVEKEEWRKEYADEKRRPPPTSFRACLQEQALDVAGFNAEFIGPLLTAAACTEAIKMRRR